MKKRSRLGFGVSIVTAVAIPLVFQVVLAALSFNLMQSASTELERASAAQKITIQANHVLQQLNNFISRLLLAASSGEEFFGNKNLVNLTELGRVFGELDRGLEGHLELKEYKKTLKSVSAKEVELLEKVDTIRNDTPNATTLWDSAKIVRQELLPTLSKNLITLNDLVHDVEMQRTNSFAKEVENESKLERAMQLVALLAVLSTLLAGISLIRQTRRGISGLTMSARKLSKNEALEGLEGVAPDFERVDNVFRTVARSVREVSQRQKTLLEDTAALVLVVDDEGAIQFANPSCRQLLGYVPQELIGTPLLSLLGRSGNSNSFAAVRDAIKARKNAALEVQLLRKNKEQIDAFISINSSQIDTRCFCVFSDITEQKKVERMKEEFIALLTHEIRKPLQSIENELQILSRIEELRTNETLLTELTRCEKTTERIVRLMNDLLELEGAQSPLMSFTFESVSIETSVKSAFRDVASLAQEKAIDLTFEGVKDNVKADQFRITQVLVNLLANAIRYSPNDTEVLVRTVRTGEFVEVNVEDWGSGVPDEFKTSIFEEYEQASGALESASGGSGLGLSIAKSIVEAHGGKIGVRDGNPNGSIFWFTLPLGW